MESLLIAAVMACLHGDRLVDWSSKLPRGLNDVIVTVEPAYTRFYIYQLGFPHSIQQCCSDKRTSVIRVPVGNGRFCVRQSQPKMKWHAKVLLKPDLEM
jgi:hypothetical protein